ncbi:hypothetical protein QZH41_016885, partial [Actinostola sp. cb2023]
TQRHSSCQELCIEYSFDCCAKDNPDACQDFTDVYTVYDVLETAITQVATPAPPKVFTEKLQNFAKLHEKYLGHLLRTKHQADYYRYILKYLSPGELVMVVDYKMKVELGIHSRENQRNWYGKRGISLHGCYIVAKTLEGEKRCELLDLWSEDTKQDAWFTQSAMDVCFKWLEKEFPGFSVYLFSDNGPHYHNSSVILYLSQVSAVFNITLKEHNFFEAGEGKSALDTHFAHISHKLIRWVRVGNNLDTGEQFADIIKVRFF